MKNDEQFKMLGKSAIHDSGFQFYVTLEISNKIEKLIKDMNTLFECIEIHNEWKKNEDWYSSKTTVSIRNDLEGYASFHPFTLKEAKKVYTERKSVYDLLMGILENSLESVKKSYSENPSSSVFEPFYKDTERQFVIVDFKE